MAEDQERQGEVSEEEVLAVEEETHQTAQDEVPEPVVVEVEGDTED